MANIEPASAETGAAELVKRADLQCPKVAAPKPCQAVLPACLTALSALDQRPPDVEVEEGTALLLDRLTSCEFFLGQYANAEAHTRRLLLIRKRLHGPEHPQVAESLNDLGGLLREQGRLAEAEALHRQALAMRLKLLALLRHPPVQFAKTGASSVCV